MVDVSVFGSNGAIICIALLALSCSNKNSDHTSESISEVSNRPAAAVSPVPEDIPLSDPHSTMGRYEIVRGAGVALCDTAEKQFAAVGEVPLHPPLCGYPFDWENTEFSQPDWIRLDPTENIDAIQEFFVARALVNAAWYEKFAPKNSPLEIINKINEEEYWAPLRDQVIAAFESGEATLERANFDLTNDGQTDEVYRMTQWSLEPSVKDAPDLDMSDRKVLFRKPCGPLHQQPWLHFAHSGEKDDLSGHLLTDARRGPTYLFQYQGKSYYSRSAREIDLNLPGRDGGFTSQKYQARPFEAMCSFGFRPSTP